MYLLDTNICIYAINGKHNHLTDKLLSIPPDEILISSVTVGELEYGAAKSHWGERTKHILRAFLSNYSTLPFQDSDARLFGETRAILEQSGLPIGILDLMIGAQGVSNNLTVVTHNTREFIRIPNIRLEDWTK